MFHKVFHPRFLLIVLFYYSFFVVVKSNSNECGTCIENGKLTDLLEKLDRLQAEMEEMKTRLSKQEQKIIFLENEMSSGLESTTGHLKSTASCPKNKAASKKSENSSPRAFSSLPTSCKELRNEGHFANGVYLVRKEDTNGIDALFCQFPGANQVREISIGNVDVKTQFTQSVHFNVQRDSLLEFSSVDSTCGGCVPFDREELNVGEAINMATGSFTAPIAGIYHFEFSAMGEEGLSFYFYSEKNSDKKIAAPYASPAGPVSFTASLRLGEGEVMMLRMAKGSFAAGNGGPGILYTGWLVEEEF